MQDKVRIAYLVSHPIQYQAPLLRRLSKESDVDLTVFFCSDFSVKGFQDPGFGKQIQWDVPLLEGYKYEVLYAIGKAERVDFWRPLNYGLAKKIRMGHFDILWVHGYGRLYNLIAIEIAKRLGVKVLLRDEATLISARRSFLKKALKYLLFRQLKSRVDGFLAIGTLNREYYRFYRIPDEKIFLVPYAVDNDFFRKKAIEASRKREELRKSLGLEPGRPVILYASKMIARKRPQDLLEAYIRLSLDGRSEPVPYLLFIGDGEMRYLLEERSADLGWDSVRFLGFKNQSELPGYYDLCDVFVLPSVDEPWGLVVNEVMNTGSAVIVSDQVGCGADLVRNGENGYVFNARNIEELYGSLSDALQTQERCRKLGENGLEIINKWGFEEDSKGLKDAIRHVLGENEK
ncbi:MAG: glycosyltransferase family 4 protein [Ignavibacteriaceae bacterium]